MPAAVLIVGLAVLLGAVLIASQSAEASIADSSSGASSGGEASAGDPAAALELGPLPEVALPDPGAAAGLLENLGVKLEPAWSPPAAAAPYLEQISAAEAANGLPSGLLARLIYQESRYRPDIIDGTTRSSAGALGIAQFEPATARDLGLDPLNPSQAIAGAAKYLRQLFDQAGSWEGALAAYNWGIGNVLRKGLDAAPLETRAYVAQITADVPGAS